MSALRAIVVALLIGVVASAILRPCETTECCSSEAGSHEDHSADSVPTGGQGCTDNRCFCACNLVPLSVAARLADRTPRPDIEYREPVLRPIPGNTAPLFEPPRAS